MLGSVVTLLAAFLVAPTSSTQDQASAVTTFQPNPVTHPASYQAGIFHEEYAATGLPSSITAITDYRKISQEFTNALASKDFVKFGRLVQDKQCHLVKTLNLLAGNKNLLLKKNPLLADQVQNQINELQIEAESLRLINAEIQKSVFGIKFGHMSEGTKRSIFFILNNLKKHHQQKLNNKNYQELHRSINPDITND